MNYGDALTLLPQTYKQHINKLRANGQFALSGHLNGPIGKAGMPALALNFSVANGALQNNDPPAKLTGMNGTGQLVYDFNVPNRATLSLKDISGKLGPDAFDASLVIQNFDDPALALDWRGEFSLGELTRLFPDLLPKAKLTGKLAGSFKTEGKLRHYNAEHIIYTRTSGQLALRDVDYKSTIDKRRVESLNGQLKFTPDAADIQQLTGMIDGNHVRFDGHFRNYMPYFLTDQGVLEAELWVRAGDLRLDPWLDGPGAEQGAQDESADESVAQNDARQREGLPDRVRVNLQAEIGTMRYDKLVAKDVHTSVRLVDRKGTVDRLRFLAFGGSFNLSGTAEQRQIAMKGEIQHVDLRQFFDTFEQFGELVMVGPHAHGKLTTNFDVRARATAGLEVDPKSIAASGNFSVSEGKLLDFPLFAEMAGFIKFNRLRNLDFGACKGEFRLEHERGYLDQLHLTANRLTIDAHGSHGFDESIDYHFAIQLPRREWKDTRSNDVQDWIATAEGEHIPLTLRMQATGTAEQPQFKLDRRAIKQHRRERRKAEKQELAREMKREKEQLFGEQSEEDADDWVITE
ncbi:MAG: AsmA-like C-terminal region-containing protein, partial [Bacteroidota bacterium]